MKTKVNRTFVCVSLLAGILIAGCGRKSMNEIEKKQTSMEKSKQQLKKIRLEHVAINVKDPVAMAEWYCKNLGMRIVRSGPPLVNTRFISDAGGNMMLELYNNPPDAVPDYSSMDPLVFHIAFMVDNVKGIREKLIAAGAKPVGEAAVMQSGDEIAMLRDPWGVAIQFIRRAEPMLSDR